MTAGGATVRPVRAEELDAVAALHRRAFPAYASTGLGQGYCRRLLRAYADRPDSWVDVAVDPTGRIAGYLVGAPPAAQHAVDRSLLPWAVANAWRQPAEVGRNARRAASRLAGLARRRAEVAKGTAPPEPEVRTDAVRSEGPAATVRVVLVAVDAAARGQGTADALLAAFARTARERGHQAADLSVAPDNAAAHRAYERNGWAADDAGAHFRLDLSGPAAP